MKFKRMIVTIFHKYSLPHMLERFNGFFKDKTYEIITLSLRKGPKANDTLSWSVCRGHGCMWPELDTVFIHWYSFFDQLCRHISLILYSQNNHFIIYIAILFQWLISHLWSNVFLGIETKSMRHFCDRSSDVNGRSVSLLNIHTQVREYLKIQYPSVAAIENAGSN